MKITQPQRLDSESRMKIVVPLIAVLIALCVLPFFLRGNKAQESSEQPKPSITEETKGGDRERTTNTNVVDLLVHEQIVETNIVEVSVDEDPKAAERAAMLAQLGFGSEKDGGHRVGVAYKSRQYPTNETVTVQ